MLKACGGSRCRKAQLQRWKSYRGVLEGVRVDGSDVPFEFRVFDAVDIQTIGITLNVSTDHEHKGALRPHN